MGDGDDVLVGSGTGPGNWVCYQGVRDKHLGDRPVGQGGWGRRFVKAALVFALEVWVRAQGQATGCVTREFEACSLGTGRVGTGRLGRQFARQLWFWR